MSERRARSKSKCKHRTTIHPERSETNPFIHVAPVSKCVRCVNTLGVLIVLLRLTGEEKRKKIVMQ